MTDNDLWSINLFSPMTLNEITQGDECEERDWEPSSVVECLPNVCKVQGSVPNTARKERERRRKPTYILLQHLSRVSGWYAGHLRLDLAASAAVSTESKEASMTRMTTALEAPGLAPWICDVT